MKEIIEKITQWAEDRNLINGSTPTKQGLKLMSEYGELCDAIPRAPKFTNEMVIKLADSLMCLVFNYLYPEAPFLRLSAIAERYKLTLEQCLEHAYNEIKDRKGIMYNGVFVKDNDPSYPDIVAELK